MPGRRMSNETGASRRRAKDERTLGDIGPHEELTVAPDGTGLVTDSFDRDGGVVIEVRRSFAPALSALVLYRPRPPEQLPELLVGEVVLSGRSNASQLRAGISRTSESDEHRFVPRRVHRRLRTRVKGGPAPGASSDLDRA